MTPQHPAPGPDSEPRDEKLRTWLSELADGEADSMASDGACRAWREDAGMRRAWHSYHLIGDVLRSEDMARGATRDADFLARLRTRLADEPVVLAPMPERTQAAATASAAATLPVHRKRQAWLVPAAAAAGFVAVAGVLVVTRLSAPDAGAAAALQARGAATSEQSLAGAAGGGSSSAAGAAMIRDAQLDGYLQAHQSMRGVGVAALPGAGLRSVDAVVPAGAAR